MERDETTDQHDPSLDSFLSATTEDEADRALVGLVASELQPVIERTLRVKLHASLRPSDFNQVNQDALEISGAAKSQLVAELAKLRTNPNSRVIRDLHAYAAGVTLNAYRQYLRTRYPLRESLKNRLRYLLTHHPQFELWEDEKGTRCGGWRKRKKAVRPAAGQYPEIIAAVREHGISPEASLIELVETVFECAGAPVSFDDLLLIVAELQEIKDDPAGTGLDEERFIVPESKLPFVLEQREQFELIWKEIRTLPLRHRTALLLNLRDKSGDCLIRLLPLLRVASIREIAETLEIPLEEFARIWNELPWDDRRIADRLGLRRQQVINLRQSARARLRRIFAKKDST